MRRASSSLVAPRTGGRALQLHGDPARLRLPDRVDRPPRHLAEKRLDASGDDEQRLELQSGATGIPKTRLRHVLGLFTNVSADLQDLQAERHAAGRQSVDEPEPD